MTTPSSAATRLKASVVGPGTGSPISTGGGPPGLQHGKNGVKASSGNATSRAPAAAAIRTASSPRATFAWRSPAPGTGLARCARLPLLPSSGTAPRWTRRFRDRSSPARSTRGARARTRGRGNADAAPAGPARRPRPPRTGSGRGRASAARPGYGRSRPSCRSISSSRSSNARGAASDRPTRAPFRNGGCSPTPTGSVSMNAETRTSDRCWRSASDGAKQVGTPVAEVAAERDRNLRHRPRGPAIRSSGWPSRRRRCRRRGPPPEQIETAGRGLFEEALVLGDFAEDQVEHLAVARVRHRRHARAPAARNSAARRASSCTAARAASAPLAAGGGRRDAGPTRPASRRAPRWPPGSRTDARTRGPARTGRCC